MLLFYKETGIIMTNFMMILISNMWLKNAEIEISSTTKLKKLSRDVTLTLKWRPRTCASYDFRRAAKHVSLHSYRSFRVNPNLSCYRIRLKMIIANPMASKKLTKKIYKLIKKGALNNLVFFFVLIIFSFCTLIFLPRILTLSTFKQEITFLLI